MKKLLILTLVLLAFSGCGNQAAVNTEQSTTTTTKQDTVSAQVGCSETNPPRVTSTKSFSSALDLCGKILPYAAYEFPDQHIILFSEDVWNEAKFEHEYTLKTVSTIPPYEEKTLRKGIPSLGYMQGPFTLKQSKAVAWFTAADAPGSIFSLFIFKPETKDFLFVENRCNGLDCDSAMDLISSKNPDNLHLIESKASSEQKKLMACNLNGLSLQNEPNGSENMIAQLEEYAYHLPDKLFCYVEHSAKISGYIDLQKYKFVSNE
ncbi:MAG: hypothetical protein PHS88_07245 [Candidatus Omnitrophica bacterium]|jgi:hypothetical protein|nr:hypothetical protein [Candidatus Omnitrophota bacterium]